MGRSRRRTLSAAPTIHELGLNVLRVLSSHLVLEDRFALATTSRTTRKGLAPLFDDWDDDLTEVLGKCIQGALSTGHALVPFDPNEHGTTCDFEQRNRACYPNKLVRHTPEAGCLACTHVAVTDVTVTLSQRPSTAPSGETVKIVRPTIQTATFGEVPPLVGLKGARVRWHLHPAAEPRGRTRFFRQDRDPVDGTLVRTETSTIVTANVSTSHPRVNLKLGGECMLRFGGLADANATHKGHVNVDHLHVYVKPMLKM